MKQGLSRKIYFGMMDLGSSSVSSLSETVPHLRPLASFDFPVGSDLFLVPKARHTITLSLPSTSKARVGLLLRLATSMRLIMLVVVL